MTNISSFFNRNLHVILLILNKVIYSVLAHQYIIINLLKPTGHVMHQQFNIQQLYSLHTLYLYVL